MTTKKNSIKEMREFYSLGMNALSGKIRPYIRVSSTGIGQSDAKQVQAFKEFKEMYSNFEYDFPYREIGSGKGGIIRKKFNDMISDAKANKFDILWIESPSRFGRDLLSGLKSMEKLVEANIRVYIKSLGKIINPMDLSDRMYFQMMMWVAETQNMQLKEDSENGTDTKQKNLAKWEKYEGLCGVKLNNPTPFDMIVEDPFWSETDCNKEVFGEMHSIKGKPHKKGICNLKVPHIEQYFQVHVMAETPYKQLAETYRKPVNPKCANGCYNGKQLPFGGMPRCSGKKYLGTKKTMSKEVGAFLDAGGWKAYIKPDSEIAESAFVNKNGIRREKRKCGCGQKMTETTICKWRKALVYDNPEINFDRVRPDAFKRLDADSTEMSWDEVEELYAKGKVSSI
jgi:DNA invertase Pin-like site-specific DNA recombinase